MKLRTNLGNSKFKILKVLDLPSNFFLRGGEEGLFFGLPGSCMNQIERILHQVLIKKYLKDIPRLRKFSLERKILREKLKHE